MSNNLKIHGVYKHFKGKLYLVEDIAYHSETEEKMVVYRALYGDNRLWCRPYDMFLEEVDHGKNPEVKQKYRFELQKDNEIEFKQKIFFAVMEKYLTRWKHYAIMPEVSRKKA